MKKHKILCLSSKDVGMALTMSQCIDAMADAFTQLAKGQAEVPLRTDLHMPEAHGRALFMPAYLPNQERVGVKAIMVHKQNPEKGMPMIHSMVMVFDSSTGSPLAVMDGEVLTAMRTGAVSGLATRLLARENSEIAAVFGAGVQGETQLEAVCAVREIKKAYVFDLNRGHAHAYAAKMGEKCGIEVVVADTPYAVSEADVICTATSSNKPVFDDIMIGAGIHINGVGSYRPDMCEIPPETVVRAKVVVDQMNASLSEAGDLVQPIEQGLIAEDHIHGELGDILSGGKPSRENDKEITFFKSVGVAVQDLAAANLILHNAIERGLGMEFIM